MQRWLFLVLALVALTHFMALGQSQTALGQAQRGQVKDGKPVGVWEYYDGKELGLRLDYDSSRIKYARPDTTRYFVQIDSSWQLVRPTRAPRLIGSVTEVVSAVQKALRYPFGDMRTNTVGTVIVNFTIDEQGNVTDGKVANAPSTTLANEVVRALGTVSLKYLPAIHQGKRVAFRISFVVRFVLQRENSRTPDYKKQSELLPAPPGSFDEIVVTGY